MSALSVLSPIVPTATGGTASASAEAAASDGLFAGMVAAVAPSTATPNSDGHAPLDLPAAESDAVEASVSDATVIVAPAWPPIPLIAPAPPPVAPSSDATDANAADATPPLSSAPLPNPPATDAARVTAPPADASATLADALPLPNTSVAPAAPLAADPAEPTPAAEAPMAQAQGGESTRPEAARAPDPSPHQSSYAQARTEPTADRTPEGRATAEVPARPTPPAAGAGEILASSRADAVESAPRSAAPSTRPTTFASEAGPAPQPSPTSTDASAGVEADQARVEAHAQTRSSLPASPQIAAAATHGAPPPVEPPSQTQAEPLKALADAPRVEVAQLPQQSAPATVASPAPRLQTMAMPQPVAALPTEVADAPEPTASAPAASISSDAEVEAAPPKAQPAPQTALPTTAAPAAPVTPARNGSSRLDDRPSNAASSSSQTDAKADAKGGALGAPASPQSPAAAQATTPSAPTLSDNVAAKPVAPVEAAPVDASAAPDLAPSQQVLDAQNATPAASRDLGLSQLSRATVETTAQLASQILKKLDGRSTRFDMALTPEGLGRVDVSMEIDSEGHLTARLAFDNPAAATELRGRADELRRQLQDAGFQLTQDSLEFSERNPSSGFGGGGAFDRAPDRRAFAGAARVAAQADAVLPPPGAWTSLSLTPDRVDMKV